MTREDIIGMAREAGSIDSDDVIETVYAAFAAAEREKVARWQIGSGYSTGHGETIKDLLVELEWQIRESEREACAKVCESEGKRIDASWMSCAEAIRARGNT